MFKYHFLILCLASIQTIFAQSDFVVTKKADTLRGEVRILTYDIQDRVLIKNDKKQFLDASKILYVVIKNETYKPVKFDNTIKLMKVMKEGFLSLFAFKPKDNNNYDGLYLLKLDGSNMEVPNLSFKRIMANFIKDCAALADRLKNDELDRKDLDKIIDEYNICVKQNDAKKINEQPIEVTSNPKVEAVKSFIKQVEGLEFTEKKDVMDLLNDIQAKAGKKENIANYQLEALKNLTAAQTTLKPDLERLLEALKQ